MQIWMVHFVRLCKPLQKQPLMVHFASLSQDCTKTNLDGSLSLFLHTFLKTSLDGLLCFCFASFFINKSQMAQIGIFEGGPSLDGSGCLFLFSIRPKQPLMVYCCFGGVEKCQKWSSSGSWVFFCNFAKLRFLRLKLPFFYKMVKSGPNADLRRPGCNLILSGCAEGAQPANLDVGHWRKHARLCAFHCFVL